MPKRIAALIVAAGRGHRAGEGLPKQYRPVAGVPMLRRTIAAFTKVPAVTSVKAVIHPDDQELYEDCVSGLTIGDPAFGGAERQDSVRLGLEALAETVAPDVVLIHDAARPFVSANLISRLAETVSDQTPAAIPGLPIVDTVRRVAQDGGQTETVDRDGLYRVQTPQAFDFKTILEAHRNLAGHKMTDDAAIAEQTGTSVRIIPGEEGNIKVTTPEDFQTAEQRLAAHKTPRTGMGFDVHRFEPGDHVTLCGVEIPHGQALAGHSDADVAMHALTDALLGAVGCGDIGQHFPPSEPQWRGAASRIFLEHACGLIADRAGIISNVDLTIICEAPKVGPHKTAMEEALAAIMKIPPERINVKATTTEKLGFTGRKEGIAAQAIATVLI